MEHVDYAELVKLAGGAVAILLIGISGFFKGRADKKDEPQANVEVLAGSVVDGRSVREVADGLRAVRQTIERFMEQQHDDSRALRALMEDNTAAVKRNTEAQDQGAVTPRDLAALIGKLRGPQV